MREVYKQEKRNVRRYKIIKPFRFFVFILVCITSLVLLAYAVTGSGKAEAAGVTRYTEVKVQDNDTIWNLLETYNPDSNIDVRMALYDVYEVNKIKTADIKAGDIILIPIY